MAEHEHTATPRCILVLGMHRSGTSAFTRVLSLLGADLPRNLMPAQPQINDAGFWESYDLYLIHEQLLASAGSSWHDFRAFDRDWMKSTTAEAFRRRIAAQLQQDFAGSDLFAVKDPRICRMVPFWLKVLAEVGAEPRILIPIRNPLEVAQSLQRRDGIQPAASCLLWLRHALDAERDSRGLARVIVSYDALLADWRRSVAGIGEHLGISWPRNPESAAAEIAEFLSAKHRHHASTDAELAASEHVGAWVKESYALLTRMTEADDAPGARAGLDAIAAELERALEVLGPLTSHGAQPLHEREGADAEAPTTITAAQIRQGLQRRAAKADLFARRLHAVQEVRQRVERELAGAKTAMARQQDTIAALQQDLASQHATVAALGAQADTLRSQLAGRQRDAAALTDRLRTREGRLQQLSRRLERAEAEIYAMRSSRSWMLTAPLRRAGETVTRMKAAVAMRLSGDGTLWRQAETLRDSGIFDYAYYVTQAGDSLGPQMDPVIHYLTRPGARELAPNPLFDPDYYLRRYPEAAEAHCAPLLHYLAAGRERTHCPCPLFDVAYYLETYPDVAASGEPPLRHFLNRGGPERRRPHPLFDTEYYLTQNPDVARQGMNPLVHYLLHGGVSGRNPSPLFDARRYLQAHPELAAAQINPLVDFLARCPDDYMDHLPSAG